MYAKTAGPACGYGMRQSRALVSPVKDISKDETSINASLLLRAGFVRKLMAGVYTFLPLGLRTLSKIEDIVRQEMDMFGSEELLMPALMPADPWQTTGRWDEMSDILFKMTGASGREMTLGPTHEEVVVPLADQFINSYKDLPCSVYQIQTKYRNEARAKSGVLRGREFRMKDMYSFHATEAELEEYYEHAKPVYQRIFARAGIGDVTYMTYASGGAFAKFSHEYQMCTEHGEDEIALCQRCEVALNKEVYEEFEHRCPECNSDDLVIRKAIEVGNIFKLGTKFTDAFSASYQDKNGKMQDKIYTGCYGIGTSRLLGAIVEHCHDERGICWPESVAPYDLHLVSLVKGEQDLAVCEELYLKLLEAGFDVLFDDRTGTSAGAKFADRDLIGIPRSIVAGAKSLADGEVELAERATGKTRRVKLNELLADPTEVLAKPQ